MREREELAALRLAALERARRGAVEPVGQAVARRDRCLPRVHPGHVGQVLEVGLRFGPLPQQQRRRRRRGIATAAAGGAGAGWDEDEEEEEEEEEEEGEGQQERETRP